MRALVACLCAFAGAGACAPLLDVDRAPCDGVACAAGFSCCDGICIDAAEPCLGACAAPVSSDASDRYQPFVSGSVWVYEETTSGTGQFENYKHLRLGAEEDLAPVADGRAHRLCREDRSFEDATNSGAIRWERDTGESAVWVRNLRIDASGVTKDEVTIPYAVRVDESPARLCVGAAFDTSWTSRTVNDPASCVDGPAVCPTTDTAVPERWLVEAIDEPVDVPGQGAMPSLRATRTMTVAGVDEVKTFWFVRGIGKVKEVVPTDDTESLLFFDIPGVATGGDNPFRPLSECDAAWWPSF